MKRLKEIVEKEKPPKIISVGDTVSRNLHSYDVIPQISIVDNKTMRKKLRPQIFPNKEIVRIKNPQGKITSESIWAIRNSLRSKRQVQIIVDGEEDLLTLIVAVYAPENALIIYGQPNEGIVVVKITSEKKVEAKNIWKMMKAVEENA
jgi:uncharacterized protein (UPF0218 family)